MSKLSFGDPVARSGRRAPVTAVLTSIHASAFADRFLTSLVAPYLIATLRLTNFQFGLVQGPIFVAPYAAATPLFGALADRRGPRRVIMVGLILWTLATIACGLAASVPQLMAARLVLGVGEAALTPAALLLIGANAPKSRFGKAVSIFLSGALLGKAAAMLLGGLLLQQLQHVLPTSFAWRGLFVLAAVPNTFLLVGLSRLAHSEIPRRNSPSVQDLTQHLRQNGWRYGAVCLPLTAGVLISQTFAAWAPLMYMRDLHMKPYLAGVLTGALLLVFGPLGSLIGGALADRHEEPTSKVGDLLVLLTVAALAAAGMLVTSSLWISCASFAALLTVIGVLGSSGLVRLQRFAPHHLRATLTSIYQATVTLVGFGLGPPLVGLLADRRLGAPVGLSHALLTVTVGVCIVGVAGASISALLAELTDSTPRRGDRAAS